MVQTEAAYKILDKRSNNCVQNSVETSHSSVVYIPKKHNKQLFPGQIIDQLFFR